MRRAGPAVEEIAIQNAPRRSEGENLPETKRPKDLKRV